ncbi:MAG TPA: VWA domain-containing protein, partial [Planctomycetota bacterium]|nr:VWA domain-containing protein [Planctomycetota bacterium]
MGFDVYLEHPAYLWILVAALPLLAFAALRSYAIAPRWKRITSFVLRTLALALVVLAITRPVWRLAKPDQSVAFAIDVSDSVDRDALHAALEHVVAATRDLAEPRSAALVLFAGRPKVVRPLAPEPIALTPPADDALGIEQMVMHRFVKEEIEAEILAIERDLTGDDAQARLDRARGRLARLRAFEDELAVGETDVREVLRLARSILPEDSRRRVVLFSDGNWTRHDPAAELEFTARAGVTVDTVAFDRPRPNEVVAERLVVPGQVKVREPVELELHVSSAEEREVEMRLYRDQFLLTTEKLTLKKGRNTLRVPKQELDEGFHEFAVRIDAKGDPTPENNVARAVVVVEGQPRVLLIEGEERDARYLEQALRDEQIQVEVRPAVGFPDNLNDLLSFDVLMISDVPATSLHTSQLGLVKQYVKDYGGGLVMLGGEKSFGLGGYYRTPVEDALPVRMPIKKTIEKPNLALVLVLDRSGSMAGEKLALAKEAAIASVEVLKAKDEIGVIVFDSAPDWVVELQPATNRDEIVTNISRVTEGGGTFIYCGLYGAWEALSASTAKLKHCIVLSDGHTEGSRDEHLDLVARMAAEGMTVSTVGIGDADQPLMTALAEMGNGEAYFTNDFGSIPQIFTKETLRASKSMLVEEPFVPALTPAGKDDPLLRGIDFGAAPLLMGYVATTPKELARVLLVSDFGDPVLAHWNYGLGRAVAFTSDAKTRWGADWVAWPQFGKFWAQIVRSVMSTGTTSVLQQTADLRIDKGEVRIAIDTRDREGYFRDEIRPRVAVLDASGQARALPTEH